MEINVHLYLYTDDKIQCWFPLDRCVLSRRNQFITCASDRTVHGPYSISPHPTPHALPHASVYIRWHAPLIPAFRSQRQVDLWIGSEPGLHREVQDSWVFLGSVSKNKRKILPFWPEQQMNLTWPSLKNRSQVVRTNIPRWSLVPSEKGLLASVSGKGCGGVSVQHPMVPATRFRGHSHLMWLIPETRSQFLV